jgi:hypothetical protein
MKTFKFTTEHVKNGRIDHLDIGDATVVIAENIGLKEIPCWENAEEVRCKYNELTELPLWLNAYTVSCCNNKQVLF